MVYARTSALMCRIIFCSQIFDKSVRALENAVNRLPGMHDLGLEHLLLEEPAPPSSPTKSSAAASTVGQGSPASAGKSAAPGWFDATGPLGLLARQVRRTQRRRCPPWLVRHILNK